MNYIVVKGDIIDSRNAKDRDKLQQQLSESLKTINEQYKNVIAAEFMITSGDGFQGLMNDAAHLFDITNLIEELPVNIRFGIGIGEVSTEIDSKNSAVIDGPCYHLADDMLNRIKTEETQNTAKRANIQMASNTQNDGIINGLLSLRYVIKSSWTKRQHEVIGMYISHDENQYKTAAVLGVNQSTVSRALKATNYYSVKSAEIEVIRFIKDVIL